VVLGSIYKRVSVCKLNGKNIATHNHKFYYKEGKKVSFIDSMIGNFLKGMDEEQRRRLIQSVQEQVLANTTPQEREAILREFAENLISSIPEDGRARLLEHIMNALKK